MRWRIGKRTIGRRGFPAYLTRWEISTPWFGIYLHKFDGPDAPIFHDHPWAFWSVVLKGGYTEQVRINNYRQCYSQFQRTFERWSVHHFPLWPHMYHFLSKLSETPTWTLVFRGRIQREWGFLSPRTGDWIRWDQFDESKEILN